MFEAFTLQGERVSGEEDRIRLEVRGLTDDRRAAFYRLYTPKIKDPDTYAALNWFFLAGLHNFYLRQWVLGIVDLVVALAGMFFIVVGLFVPGNIQIGLALLFVVSAIELPALFRSQVIVQNYNNKTAKRILIRLNR